MRGGHPRLRTGGSVDEPPGWGRLSPPSGRRPHARGCGRRPDGEVGQSVGSAGGEISGDPGNTVAIPAVSLGRKVEWTRRKVVHRLPIRPHQRPGTTPYTEERPSPWLQAPGAAPAPP